MIKAEVLLALGRVDDAEPLLSYLPVPETEDLKVRLWCNQGVARYRRSDFTRAEQFLDQAREVANRMFDRRMLAEVELRRGPLLIALGHNNAAEAALRSALEIAHSAGDQYLEAGLTGNLGYLFLNTYQYEQAAYWLEQARTISLRIGAANSVARAVGNLGFSRYRLGDMEGALRDFVDAETRFRATGSRHDQQVYLGNAGSVLMDLGDSAGASAKYSAALEISRSIAAEDWAAWWLFNLARAAIAENKLDDAERYNRESLTYRDKLASMEYYPRVNEAKIAAARGQPDLAERLYSDLLAKPSADPVPVLEAELGMAKIQIALNRAAKAVDRYRAAISRIETLRGDLTRDEFKLSYLDSLIRFYSEYLEFLVGRGDVGQALALVESSRARLLAERIADTGPKRTVGADALKALAARSGSILLSYWLAPKRSFVFVVTPQRIDLHELPPDREIAAQVERYRAMIEHLRDPLDSENPAGRKLAEMLLGPVANELAGASRVVIVSDRALTALNFETLPDPANPRQYLIDRLTVAVAPSLSVMLAGEAAARKSTPSILLIGDPTRAAEEFPPLPFAGQEIDKIAARFAADRRKVVRGAEASPNAYARSEPGRYPWIHFAAHASANRERPLESALILSPGESGYTLTARDVMQTPLHADLVTLSACRSAGARAYSGEGLVGLAWAFLRAGSRSVVAGLWDVTDASTATLMADFYERLLKGEPPPQALRGAKLAMLHSHTAYAKPFYWGPFQIYLGAPAP